LAMEIEDIRNHLAIADGTDLNSGTHRWAAARGIWEHRQLGKSLRQVGEEIGRSHMYVQYYERVWALAGREVWEAATDKATVVFPEFKDIYYSVEVRGPSIVGRHKDADTEEGAEDIRTGADREEYEPEEEEDFTAHGLVTTAANAISRLYGRKGEWATLSHEDRLTMGKIANQLLTIGTR
jgi:hypothetical protein